MIAKLYVAAAFAAVLVYWVSADPASATRVCPDGTMVSGSSCTLAPDGTWGKPGRVLLPDGTYGRHGHTMDGDKCLAGSARSGC